MLEIFTSLITFIYVSNKTVPDYLIPLGKSLISQQDKYTNIQNDQYGFYIVIAHNSSLYF
jgi:hypothetical protein